MAATDLIALAASTPVALAIAATLAVLALVHLLDRRRKHPSRLRRGDGGSGFGGGSDGGGCGGD